MKFCRNCGEEISESAFFCTKCGASTTADTGSAPYRHHMYHTHLKMKPMTNSLCLAGFIVSIAGILVLPPFSGIVGIILSSIGLKQIKSTEQYGKGMAVTGILVGFLDIIVGLFIIYAYVYYFRYYNYNFI